MLERSAAASTITASRPRPQPQSSVNAPFPRGRIPLKGRALGAPKERNARVIAARSAPATGVAAASTAQALRDSGRRPFGPDHFEKL